MIIPIDIDEQTIAEYAAALDASTPLFRIQAVEADPEKGIEAVALEKNEPMVSRSIIHTVVTPHIQQHIIGAPAMVDDAKAINRAKREDIATRIKKGKP